MIIPENIQENAKNCIVWFRDRLDDQSNCCYEDISNVKRAVELAENGVSSGLGRMGVLVVYDDKKEIFRKVVGHIKGKLEWIDPWV